MLDELQLYRGNDFKINDHISIHHPRLGEICDYGEQKYFEVVNALTANPSMYKVWLGDNNLDYEKIADFDFFCLMCRNLAVSDTSILLGGVDLSTLDLMFNKETGQNVLADLETGVVIDNAVYMLMTDYIRKIHGFEKKEAFGGNAHAKQYLIEKERRRLAALKNRKQESMLVPLVSALVNCEQFKYNHDSVWNLRIHVFMDAVRRIQLNLNFKFYMQGAYSGMVKTDGDVPNWLGTMKD